MKEERPLYDARIDIDITNFPAELKEIIRQLEQFKSEEGWIMIYCLKNWIFVLKCI